MTYTKQIITIPALALLFGMAAAVADNHDRLAKYADPAEPALPATNVDISLGDTALVITDPQIDFLSPEGVTWGVVGESVTENNTVQHIDDLFAAAKKRGMLVAILFPTPSTRSSRVPPGSCCRVSRAQCGGWRRWTVATGCC